MPFVQRVIEPKYLSRTSLFDENGKAKVADGELEVVTNNTLSNALRQLASLVLAANDIFTELTKELQKITERSHCLKGRIGNLDGRVAAFDPKKVTVPESDISTFALLKKHYVGHQEVESNLFTSQTRPSAVQALYEAAAKTPVHVIRQMDRWRRDGTRSSRFFVCTPVIGQKRRKIRNKVDIEIETRMPAAVEELRRWTSSEALGDITVTPDCISRIPPNVTLSDGNVTDGTVASDDEGIDHKLPSPEEQVQAVALKFPAEVVAVDVSGRRFTRMSTQRRSILYRDASAGREGRHEETAVAGDGSMGARKQTRSRRSRTRRRTTLAGTDEKEIKNALSAGTGTRKRLKGCSLRKEPSTSQAVEDVLNEIPPFIRSKSSDLLRSSTRKPNTSDTKKSHFQTLKEWSRNRFKLNRSSENSKNDDHNKEKEKSDSNVYETITVRRRRSLNREKRTSHERNPSYSSSEKSSVNIPIAKPLSSAAALAVRLRDSSTQRRSRNASDNKDEPRSSSGNWSASSESGRASIGSEITTHPKSTTSAATSNNSLNQHPPNSSTCVRKFTSVSASDSVTSEGTLTPDIHDFHEDMDSSSVYSCDTEGYYTSFHVDSGLKTLKEEDAPPMAFHVTSAFSNTGSPTGVLSAESEYELFGKGSTSTTASSAGTVCTTLKAADSDKSLFVGPSVPERKSSLNKSKENVVESTEKNGTIKRSPASTKATIVAVIHKQTNGDVSPDSGHNTSSSPTQSANSPNGGRSGSEFEYSECSDMEGTDRIERIKTKTAINSSRIPSMCVITPPHSDDESVKSFWEKGAESGSLEAIKTNPITGYVTLESLQEANKPADPVPSKTTFRAPSPSGGTVSIKNDTTETDNNNTPQMQPFIKATLLPLNVFGKLKLNISNFSSKTDNKQQQVVADNGSDEYDEYVTIADIRNNNGKLSKPKPDLQSDSVSQKLNDVLSNRIRETEYVSLDELPSSHSPEKPLNVNISSLERIKRQGARVTLDSDGKVVYSSDSLRRNKGAQTTFEPGPFVKEKSATPEASPLTNRRTMSVRPVSTNKDKTYQNTTNSNRPMSPQLGMFVIRASSGMASPTKEVIRVPSSTVVAPPPARPVSPKCNSASRGAYVHMQEKLGSRSTKEQVPSTDAPASFNRQDVRTWTLPQKSSMDLYGHWAQDKSSVATLNYYQPPKYQTFPHRKPESVKPNYSNISKMPEVTGTIVTRNHVEFTNQYGENYPNIANLQNFSIKSSEKQQNRDGKPDETKSYESFKISPIDPCRSSSFQSSTPAKPEEGLKYAANLESKLLSPKRTTMSNEELYAVIHKSKKKLNIQTEEKPPESVEEVPAPQPPPIRSPETGYLRDKSRDRSSWSPNENQLERYPGLSSSPGNRQSWAYSEKKTVKQTSQMDFKRLLLQQSAKSNITSNNKKLSAVEQLKLSKQNIQPKTNKPTMDILDLSSSPRSLQRKFVSSNVTTSPKTGPEKSRSPAKLMSPRSQWRFASPRTDVLSSTILEDCREDESSGSSLEKKSNAGSPQNEPKADHGHTDLNKLQRVSSNETGNISPKMSVSQYIKAKRAQFFSSTPKNENENTNNNSNRFSRSTISGGKEKLPTLETSF